MVPALRAPRSCGPHSLCTFLSPQCTQPPAFTLGLLQMYTGLTNTNTHLRSHSELGGCMHTRAHKEIGSIQSPVWCPGVPMGLCQLHPPALMQSPGRRGGHHPGAQWSAQMWANRQRVCTRGACQGCSRSRPVLGPDPLLPEQLFRALSPLPCLHPAPHPPRSSVSHHT